MCYFSIHLNIHVSTLAASESKPTQIVVRQTDISPVYQTILCCVHTCSLYHTHSYARSWRRLVTKPEHGARRTIQDNRLKSTAGAHVRFFFLVPSVPLAQITIV